MLPAWIQRYVKTDGIFEGRSHLPLYALIILLHEIGQFDVGKDFLLVEPPQSLVYHGGQGMYLYHQGTHLPFATFNMVTEQIMSMGLRYNDPLNPASKRREDRIITGWQGVAELIASAVRRSPFFGKLETIETKCRTLKADQFGFGNANRSTISNYEIWVTPLRNWSVDWNNEPWEMMDLVTDDETGEDEYEPNMVTLVDRMEFQVNSPILLATIKVERPISDELPDVFPEVVMSIQIYPTVPDPVLVEQGDFETVDGESRYPGIDVGWSWAHIEKEYPPPLRREHPFEYLSVDGTVLNLPPHSELKLSFRS